MENRYKEDAKIFKALCDEKRLYILNLLQNGEKCACELIDDMNIGQSALSYHMKILCESGVVKNRKEGKWTYYSISNEGCEYAFSLLKILTKVHSNENVDNSKCKN